MISIHMIQRLVAERFGIPLWAMTTPDRHREWAWPRQLAMALAWEFTSGSMTWVGRHFGGRDRTTVINALEAVEERAGWDLETLRARAQLRARLESRLAAPQTANPNPGRSGHFSCCIEGARA